MLRRRLLQEGNEGGAHGAAPQRLLHTEVVHHGPLDLLLGGGEQEAPEDCQLWRRGANSETNTKHTLLLYFLK